MSSLLRLPTQRRLLWLALTSVCLLACGSSSPDPTPTLGDELQNALDQVVVEMGAPGATLAVALPDEPVWLGATGMADREAGLAMKPNDRFGIGSITKTFTASVVLQLQEEGVLSLDDTLESWYPGFPRGELIALRNLLSHTTGIYDFAYHGKILANSAAYWEPEELVALAAGEPPLFDPGEAYDYSNTNFILLGLVVEAATGKSWAKHVRDRLLDPLQLDDTIIASDEPIGVDDVAKGYFVNADWTTQVNPSTGWAAGAMVSNAADLVAWIDALLFGDVLSPASKEAMQTPFELNNNKTIRYGLGLRLKSTSHGKATKLGHGGDAIVYRSDMYHRSVEGITVVALVNGYPHEADRISDVAWDIVLDP